MSSSSLKDILRKAIFEQFRKVPSGSTSILITDTRSERLLLDSKCTFEEFQGFGIREVTTLITRRAAFPTWNAVYFLTPTPEAVQRIIEDFDRRNRLYETAYVFFTTPLPDYLFEDFQNSGVLEFIRELIEMEIDFIPMEARVFMVDYEEATQELFGFATDSEVDVLIGGIAKKLRSALATLNEQPYIRYHSPDGSMESLSARLATSLHKEMLDLKKFDPNFPKPTPYDFNGPATLLIVDRSIDLISPLLHTLSYQSLVHDLFEVEEEDINGMKRLVVEVDTQKGIKKALVDGIDELYNSIRHLFFIDAFDSVKQSVREFIKATSLAAKLSGSAGVETLKNAIINLPEMLKKKDQLDALISFNAQLNNAVMVDRSLNELCELEQVLCVGETPDGDDPDPKALWVAFEELMENDDVLLDDKIRLLLLYTLTVDGLDDEDRQSLAEGASITIEDLAAVDGLRHFGVTPGEKRDVKKPDSPFTIQARKLALEVSRGTGGRRRNNEFSILNSLGLGFLAGGGNNEEEDKSMTSSSGEDYLLERYLPKTQYDAFDKFCPAISFILQDHLLGRLSHKPGDPFPYIEEPSKRNRAQGIVSAVRRHGESRRGPSLVVDLPQTTSTVGRFKWGRARPNGDGVDDYRLNGPRTIIFILGGLSYAEIRAVYLIAQKYQREIYIGSTNMLVPNSFVGVLDFFGKSSHDPVPTRSKTQRWGKNHAQKSAAPAPTPAPMQSLAAVEPPRAASLSRPVPSNGRSSSPNGRSASPSRPPTSSNGRSGSPHRRSPSPHRRSPSPHRRSPSPNGRMENGYNSAPTLDAYPSDRDRSRSQEPRGREPPRPKNGPLIAPISTAGGRIGPPSPSGHGSGPAPISIPPRSRGVGEVPTSANANYGLANLNLGPVSATLPPGVDLNSFRQAPPSPSAAPRSPGPLVQPIAYSSSSFPTTASHASSPLVRPSASFGRVSDDPQSLLPPSSSSSSSSSAAASAAQYRPSPQPAGQPGPKKFGIVNVGPSSSGLPPGAGGSGGVQYPQRTKPYGDYMLEPGGNGASSSSSSSGSGESGGSSGGAGLTTAQLKAQYSSNHRRG